MLKSLVDEFGRITNYPKLELS